MKIPKFVNKIKFNNLSTASQLSLLAIVILLGAVFFTVNSALQQQTNPSSHAAVTSYANIFLRNHTTATNTGTNSLTITVPSNKVAGDLLVAHIVVHSTSTTISAPSGWTLIRKDNTGTSLISALYRKAATGVDTKYTWKFSSAQNASGGMSDVANANTSSVDASSGKYNYLTTSMTAPAVTTTIKTDELLFFGAVDGSVSVTPPSGMTTSWTAKDSKNTSYMARLQLAAVGSTGAKTAKSSIKASNVSQLLAIKPKAISGPTPTPTKRPTPTPTKKPTITPTKGPTPTPTKMPKITPTKSPTKTPTPPPSVSPSPSANPSPSNSPSPSPSTSPSPSLAQGSTSVSLTVALHGIGSGGDSANPDSQGNDNPLHPTRQVSVDIYDVQNQLVVSQDGSVTFDPTSGKFTGTVDLGESFSTGLYTIKVKTNQYLRAEVPGIQTITAGQTNTMPVVTLIAGDINGDNAINIEDYNILIGCYSDLLPATDCTPENNALADLTDDGHVNQFDYNLFLRELTNIGGQ